MVKQVQPSQLKPLLGDGSSLTSDPVTSGVLTDLLWKVLQQVLPQAQVGQVGEVPDASG